MGVIRLFDYYMYERPWTCIANDIRDLNSRFEHFLPRVKVLETVCDIITKRNMCYKMITSKKPTVKVLSVFDRQNCFVCYIYLDWDYTTGRVDLYLVDNGGVEDDKTAKKLSGGAYGWNCDFRNVFYDIELLGD